MIFIVRHGTLVARHPHVAIIYPGVLGAGTPVFNGCQYGGVYGIMCLSLLKKERAFVR